MGDFRKLTSDFQVSPQLEPGDFAAAAAMGIKTIVNNRPDGEQPGQMASAEAAAAASAAGLAYHHVPVVSGRMTPDDVEAMRGVLAESQGPWLAYCRSGTRSCNLWALATAAERSVAATIEAADGAGYDISGLAPVLARFAPADGR